MASILVIIGSFLGLVGGIFAYTSLEMSLLAAIGIWAISGPLSVLFIAGLRTARTAETSRRSAETA